MATSMRLGIRHSGRELRVLTEDVGRSEESRGQNGNLNRHSYLDVFDDQTACPEVGIYPLYFYEGATFAQIGGWKAPYLQYYTNIELCGRDLQVNKVISEFGNRDLIQ